MQHAFIAFVCAVPYGLAYKLAVSDGQAQVGDGWANVHLGYTSGQKMQCFNYRVSVIFTVAMHCM